MSSKQTGSRTGAIGRAEAYFDSGEFEAELARRVAIKSESQKLPEKPSPSAIAIWTSR